MKKVVLTFVAAISTCMVANAQTGKGSIMIGGGLNVNLAGKTVNKVTPPSGNATSTETKGNLNWNVSPTAGYFISDNIVVGLNLNVGSSFFGRVASIDGKKEETVNTVNLGAGVFSRYYKEVGNGLYLFGQVSVDYTSGTTQNRTPDILHPSDIIDGNKIKNNIIGVNITPGLTYFFSNNWGVDFSLNNIIGYTSMKSTSQTPNNNGSSSTSSSQFNIGLGLTPTLGVNYYFGK